MSFPSQETIRKLIFICLTLINVSSFALSTDPALYRSHAARLIGDHRWNEAIDIITQGLESHPDDPYLLITGGALSFQLQQVNKAEELLSRGLRKQGLSPQLLRLAASVRRRQGRFEECASLLQRALKINPHQAESYHEMALTAYLQGDEEVALDFSSRAVRLKGSEVRYRKLYALLLDRAGRVSEAYYQLRLAQRLAPQDSRVLFRLADRARLNRNYGQALEYLDLAAELDPENPLFHYEQAKILKKIDLPREALEAEERGLHLERLLELYISALDLASRQQYLDARQLIEEAVQDNPGFFRGALLLADLHYKMGEPDRALQVYLKILKQDSSLQAAREQGAWIQASSGDIDSALKLLQEGSALSVNELLFKGHQLLESGQWADALRHFKTVQRVYPLDTRLLSLISHCLSALGEMESALEYLERANRVEPENPIIETEIREVRFRQALELESEKKWDKALEKFSILEREHPGDASIIFHVGYALQNLGSHQEAAERYEEGLALEPDQDWVRINLAYCYYLLQDFAGASRQWECLLQRRNKPEYLYHLGLSRLRELRLAEGWELIESAEQEGYGPARNLLRQRDQRARHTAGR